MIIEPDQLIACPECSSAARYSVMISGNTFGSTVWTDGFMYSPMFLASPVLARCENCNHIYWFEDAVRDELDSSDRDALFSYMPELQEPSESECYEALSNNFARNLYQERYIRILAWWKNNDQFRNRDSEPPSLIRNEEARNENLIKLLPLFDETDENDLIMKSEVLRELNRFDDAIALLDTIEIHGNTVTAIRQIRVLCEKRNPLVKAIKEDRSI